LSRRTGPEKPIGDALIASYAGVYAPTPLVPVLTGVGGQPRLSYKIVRQAAVTARLVGPDGAARWTYSGPAPPGTYPLDWNGLDADPGPARAGRWRWVWTDTDTTGQTSTAERTFDHNRTLASPRSIAPALAVPRAAPRAVAEFTLPRAATVVPRSRTTSGVILRRLPRQRASAGAFDVAWDGLTGTGATVQSGRYVADVTATNEIGSVAL